MARRLVMSAGTFVMGPPGVDCLAATEGQLLFDINGSPYNGAYLVGRMLASAFSESSQSITGGTKYTRTATLNFGRTFPAIPRLYCGILDPTVSPSAFVPNPLFSDAGETDITGTSTGSALALSFAVSTSEAVFTVTYIHYSGSGYTRTLDVPYIVFQV